MIIYRIEDREKKMGIFPQFPNTIYVIKLIKSDGRICTLVELGMQGLRRCLYITDDGMECDDHGRLQIVGSDLV